MIGIRNRLIQLIWQVCWLRTPHSWIVDFGATNHMASSLNLLSDSTALTFHKSIHLPNGSSITITHTGTSTFSCSHSLHNVLHIPDFTDNLLSFSKITKDLQCFVSFYPEFCLFQDLWSSVVKGTGRLQGGLYIYNPSPPTAVSQYYCLSFVSLSSPSCSAPTSTVSSSLWHNRMGHAPLPVFLKIPSLKNHVTTPCNCLICPLTKQSRLSFPSSSIKFIKSFDLVRMDIWGPYKVCTFNGFRYFLTLVDDCTRIT